MLVVVSNTIIAPALPQIATELSIHSATLNNMVFSIFTLALSFGPLVFLPISDMLGRLWVCSSCLAHLIERSQQQHVKVFHAGAMFLTTFNFACAYARSVGALLAFRFLGQCQCLSDIVEFLNNPFSS